MTNEKGNEVLINGPGGGGEAQQSVCRIKTEKPDPEIEQKMQYLQVKVKQEPKDKVSFHKARANTMQHKLIRVYFITGSRIGISIIFAIIIVLFLFFGETKSP